VCLPGDGSPDSCDAGHRLRGQTAATPCWITHEPLAGARRPADVV